MTKVTVYFEHLPSWYAEEVAEMDEDLYHHPKMQKALQAIAKEWGFVVTESEKE